jgi:hypothetical protein
MEQWSNDVGNEKESRSTIEYKKSNTAALSGTGGG